MSERVPWVVALVMLALAVAGAAVDTSRAAPVERVRAVEVAPWPGHLCIDAAREAAARHGVPADVMLAITLVETGTTRNGHRGPWPWTLNVAGAGAWFDSRAEASRAAERAIAGGNRSIDLGCFQINHRWHGMHFPDVGAMLDPAASADYAARFLAGLRAEAGDWTTAIGWYHSRTPGRADAFRARVKRAMQSLGDADG